MLILFFTIVFIAQIIVTAKIISVIKEININVLDINQQVVEAKQLVEQNIKKAKDNITGITTGLCGFTKFVEKKKKDIIKFAIKGAVAIILIIALKKFPNKRCLKLIDNLFSLGNFLKIV